MLDKDLAQIYGYSVKSFNQQVKNNIEKFAEDFRFQLTDEEVAELSRSKISTLNNDIDNLRSKFLTANTEDESSRSKILTLKNGRGKNIKYNPYAFTEQGIYMLMTVLKGDLATKQSIALIRLFKQMKDFILQRQNLISSPELLQLSLQTAENTKDIQEIKNNMVSKDELSHVIKDFTDPNIKKDYLFFNGETVEADITYSTIYSSAKKTIYIIDNYIGLKTLVLLKSAKTNVQITIFSDNIGNRLHKNEFSDFCKEYPGVHVSFIKTNGVYHDRYIITDFGTADETIYHCGGSSKDAGTKVTSISQVEDKSNYQNMVNILSKNQPLVL
jgi:phage regulator Rha-like protein